MKILYLQLINSAGIWAGMSRKTISLDFMKSTNKIVMLFGQNGGGKSTLLSSLNPFTGSTNDERKSFFREGMAGEKQIHYKLGDVVYMIHHYVSEKKKTKSYMSSIDYSEYKKLYKNKIPQSTIDKKGKELNENGGVKTFEELVLNYLGVDEEFFKISRIGSNVTNFIDLSTAARKNYISLFLPSVDEYLKRYKLVSDKLNTLKKELKFVTDEINKLDKQETIEENLEYFKSELNEKNKAYEKILNIIQDLKTKINLLDPDEKFKEDNYKVNPYKDEYKRAKKIYENAQSYFDEISDIVTSEDPEFKYSENYDEIIAIINRIITRLNNEINNLTKDETVIKASRDKLKESYSELEDSINSKKKQLENLSDEDIDNLRKLIQEHQDNINDAETNKRKLDISRFDYSKKDISKINIYTATLTQLKTLLSSIKTTITLEEETILKNIFCNNKMTAEQFRISYNELKQEDLKEKNEIAEISKKIAELKMSKRYIDILNNRPTDCTIDSCPFIKEALKYENVLDNLVQAESKLKDLEMKNSTTNKEISKFENVFNIIEKISTHFKDNKSNISDALSIFGVPNSNVNLLMNFLLKNDVNRLNEVFNISDLVQYIEYDNYILNETSKIENIEYKISTNEKIEEVKSNLKKELEEAESKLKDISSELEEVKIKFDKISTELSDKTNELETMNKIMEHLNEIVSTISNYNTIKKQYEDTESTLNDIISYLEKLYDYIQKRKSYKTEISDITDRINDLTLSLNRLTDYTTRKENLDMNYTKINLVKEALSPTKGIPIYFINNYLDNTTLITNKLLDISQKGKFAISFEVNDKDFFIRVFKNNGDILEDIRFASQGETSLTSLSLSLALMQQSMKVYDIFMLDEIDGALDTSNRRAFIEMVNVQIKEFNAEQVFIISHNNEFESYPIDMILLPGNDIDLDNKEFMNGKNVIFKA